MAIRPRGNKYQVDVRFEGNRIRHAFDSHSDATIWEAQAKADIKAGKRPAPPLTSNVVAARTTLKGVLDALMEADWKTAKDRDGLEARALMVCAHFGPQKALREITFPDIDAWVTALKNSGNAAATINRKLAALSKLFTFGRRYDPALIQPVIPRQREARPRDRVLSKDEFRRLIAWDGWSPHERRLTMFLWLMGCRLSEALKLRPADVKIWHDDRKNRKVGTILFDNTKNGDPRRLPIPAKAMSILEVDVMPNGPVFPVRSDWSYRRTFEAACTSCGFVDVVIHTMRHSCASRMAAEGVDAFKLQKWMGHKSMATTQRYVKFHDPFALEDLAEIV